MRVVGDFSPIIAAFYAMEALFIVAAEVRTIENANTTARYTSYDVRATQRSRLLPRALNKLPRVARRLTTGIPRARRAPSALFCSPTEFTGRCAHA